MSVTKWAKGGHWIWRTHPKERKRVPHDRPDGRTFAGRFTSECRQRTVCVKTSSWSAHAVDRGGGDRNCRNPELRLADEGDPD
jgi:hypothetical protein